MIIWYLIFAAVLIGGVIALMVFLRRDSHLCAWCHSPTRKIGDLPDAERAQIGDLIREEGMDPEVSYELCEACRRIYDEWWFGADWDVHDRWCACGYELSIPWDVDPRKLRQAVADLPPAVITLLSERYSPDEMAHLRRGYDDLDYRFERSPEEHPLRVCDICHRVYMWFEIKGFQVFQCVSSGREKYEGVSDRRQMET